MIRRGPLRWFAEGGWYYLVVVATIGLFSFVPFVHAAIRLRSPLTALWAALYAGALAVLVAFNDEIPAVGLYPYLMGAAACVQLTFLRRRVWPRSADEQRSARSAELSEDPAVDAVLVARQRRAEARRIAAEDPLLAHELAIGRPDLARSYDDGGLVDLNAAPAEALVQFCGLDAAVAEEIVRAREHGIRFATVEDVFAFVDVAPHLWDRVRDRAVVIAG